MREFLQAVLPATKGGFLFIVAVIAFIIVACVSEFIEWRQQRKREWCKHLKEHVDFTDRWIQVEAKKNHPPDVLLERTGTCHRCGKEVFKNWFTEEQCHQAGITVPKAS